MSRYAALLFALLFLAALASPPPSISQTLGINQRRTNSVPWMSITSVSSVQNSSIQAVTSPSYLGPEGNAYIFSGYDWVGKSVYCSSYDGSKYYKSPYPSPGYSPSILDITVPSSDGRAYVVACGSSDCSLFCYTQKCEFLYAIPGKSIGMSPLVLSDNSVLLGLDNQLIIVANSSSPFPGQVLWRYNFTLPKNKYSAVTALSSDDVGGILYAAYVDCQNACSVFVIAMQPLLSQVGYSLIWSQPLGKGYLSCSATKSCRSVPAVCDENVLIVMTDSLVALDQKTGGLLWTYNASLQSSSIVDRAVACHTGGWIFVATEDYTMNCLKANGTSVNKIWSYDTTPYKIARNPVVDKAGNVYVLAGASSPTDNNKGFLFSWDLSGNLLFAKQVTYSNNDSTSPRYSSQLVLWENAITAVVGSIFNIIGN